MNLLGPNGGAIVKIRPRSWLELLPAPWNEDPSVVLVYAPRGSVSRVMHTRDDRALGVMEFELDGRQRVQGLQVLYPQLNSYITHEEVFARAKVPMATVQFHGRLSQLPQAALTSEDFVPLVFDADAMWRPYLDVVRYLGAITKDYNKEIN